MSGKMLVTNYEQVGTITGNGSFGSATVKCNPGNASAFALLSNIALHYSKFRWKYLRFVYVPQAPSSTAGSVFLYLSYDFRDAFPTSLTQVTASADSCTGNAWFGGPIDEERAFRKNDSDYISLTCDPKQYSLNWYYVRNDASADDLASIQFGSTTNAGAITVGQNGGSLTAIPTGSSTTLVNIPDTSARPVALQLGSNGVTNALVAGYVYACYQCELAAPVVPAAQN